MAIIRNTASMMLKGRVGATTYYVADSRQLARQAMNNSNYGENATRTDLQQARRVKWSNLVNFYSANKAWMKKAYEDLKPGVSIFNRFMQLNINSADVALTKGEAQAKIWVPASYRVSQGSLLPLRTSFDGGLAGIPMVTDIEVTAQTTVGQFSAAIIASNPQFANGDAIAFVAFMGTFGAPGDSTGLEPATYNYDEFVIDTTEAALMTVKFPNFTYEESVLRNELSDGVSGAVFIHTRKSGGKLYVSTQDIVMYESEDSNAGAWRSSAQFAKAIASYGESTTVPLAPGGQGSLGSGNDSSSGGIPDVPGGEGSLG